MHGDEQTIDVPGRYFWQLVFDYVNPGHSKITEEREITLKRVVNRKEFLEKTFNIKTDLSFGSEASAKVTFKGVGDASTKTNYGFHLATANALTTRSEREESLEEQHVVKRKFDVGPGDRLKLYQLCYESAGVLVESDILTNEPPEEVQVTLRFACARNIVGLESILSQFGHTYPGRSNVLEWAHIREMIVKHSDESQVDRFWAFVETLSKITPGRSNTVEWAHIRTTCDEILATRSSDPDLQAVFNKLLARFSDTRPGSENTLEWAAIRRVADGILEATRDLQR